MVSSSSKQISRETLKGYDDSAVLVDDESVNHNNAPVQSQDFPIESRSERQAEQSTTNLKFTETRDQLPPQPISVVKEVLLHLRTRQELLLLLEQAY